MESNHLFHEMWHAYQAYRENESSHARSMLNAEIEAWYAQYLYVSSLPDYTPGSPWHDLYIFNDLGRLVKNMDKYVDKKGNLRVTNPELDVYLAAVEQSFRNLEDENGDKPYKDYPYDDNRIGISNFKNLQQLSLNCN